MIQKNPFTQQKKRTYLEINLRNVQYEKIQKYTWTNLGDLVVSLIYKSNKLNKTVMCTGEEKTTNKNSQ